MPQSLTSIYVHLIFSTKDRQPVLDDPQIRTNIHAYLGGISNRLDCPPIIVGGVHDHVHLLAHLGRTISVADWVKELKRVSNLWLKDQDTRYQQFEWQRGYGAFSVSQSNVESVKEYIVNQDEHHRKMTFQDELRALLKRHHLEWDERYIWD